MNLRYVEYARQTGAKSPRDALTRDAAKYPGGKMAGFMVWMNRRWAEWCQLKNYRRTMSGSHDHMLSQADHDEFDAWLKARRP